jgi:hypothetical protein
MIQPTTEVLTHINTKNPFFLDIISFYFTAFFTVSYKGKGKVHPTTGHKDPEGE